MDVFIEQIIERKPDSRHSLIRLCLIAAVTLISGLFLTAALLFGDFIVIIAFAGIAGAIWFGVLLIKGMEVEYEYILTNKELDIDKIIGKRKRQRMITLNLLNAEKFVLCTEEVSFNADVTVLAHDNTYANMWCLVVKHDVHGKAVLLFNPNDSFAIKLNNALPKRVRNEKIIEITEKETADGSSAV